MDGYVLGSWVGIYLGLTSFENRDLVRYGSSDRYLCTEVEGWYFFGPNEVGFF